MRKKIIKDESEKDDKSEKYQIGNLKKKKEPKSLHLFFKYKKNEFIVAEMSHAIKKNVYRNEKNKKNLINQTISQSKCSTTVFISFSCAINKKKKK